MAREVQWNARLAQRLTEAIHAGDLDALAELFAGDSSLAEVRLVDGHGTRKTLMHVATDWPGGHTNSAETIAWLARSGVPIDAPVSNPAGGAPETPLHWAASADDVVAIDALLENGADLEAPGAVFTGGTAMSDAVVFKQFEAAHRLLLHGAATTVWQAAAIGLLDRVEATLADATDLERNAALWHACANDRLDVARRIAREEVDWHEPAGDGTTRYDVAMAEGSRDLKEWVAEAAPPKPSTT